MNTSPNPNKSTEQEESKDGHGNSNENENELEIENENNGGVRAEAFDDRTLLDTFGEAAKEYLTHRVVRTGIYLSLSMKLQVAHSLRTF